jgi:hypothetical protein
VAAQLLCPLRSAKDVFPEMTTTMRTRGSPCGPLTLPSRHPYCAAWLSQTGRPHARRDPRERGSAPRPPVDTTNRAPPSTVGVPACRTPADQREKQMWRDLECRVAGRVSASGDSRTSPRVASRAGPPALSTRPCRSIRATRTQHPGRDWKGARRRVSLWRGGGSRGATRGPAPFRGDRVR